MQQLVAQGENLLVLFVKLVCEALGKFLMQLRTVPRGRCMAPASSGRSFDGVTVERSFVLLVNPGCPWRPGRRQMQSTATRWPTAAATASRRPSATRSAWATLPASCSPTPSAAHARSRSPSSTTSTASPSYSGSRSTWPSLVLSIRLVHDARPPAPVHLARTHVLCSGARPGYVLYMPGVFVAFFVTTRQLVLILTETIGFSVPLILVALLRCSHRSR